MKFTLELNLPDQPDVPAQMAAASALDAVQQSLLTPRDVTVQPIRGDVLDGEHSLLGSWTIEGAK